MTDTQLWALLIEGPDDLYAMPSENDARFHAALMRPHLRKSGLAARVVPWPYSAEAHAENMKEHLKDFS